MEVSIEYNDGQIDSGLRISCGLEVRGRTTTKFKAAVRNDLLSYIRSCNTKLHALGEHAQERRDKSYLSLMANKEHAHTCSMSPAVFK